ncbi:ATP-binding protein [Methyloceanibacter sp.]|uniref:ATP-binding protein n=1 Tax=Methyloceanibacter sp. TaxID=1965321 RepID=UPI002D74D757|nr:adenylate/guanylate cyclase domain-containing protein [Methyloceanibacter sp.]HZP09694.1 adenylate/guanylate cyclase domain-containing protein [Methyloceanibacter sp.]
MARGSTAPLRMGGERRHLTVMFTDMVDFTALSESLSEEQIFALTRRIAGEQAKAIQAQGGVVQDFAGDGLMAVFGAPVAMEDAALRACRTALDIQDRVARLHGELESAYGVSPKLRIGIHSGPAVIGQIGEGAPIAYSALGDTVNVASRLQASAEPGSVCITKATFDLVDGFIETTFLGTRQFNGKAKAIGVYRLDALRSGVTRFGAKRRHGLTRLRGREAELALLREHWNVAKQGRFRRVNVIGDAGLGKSRLIFEFTESLHEEPVLLLEAICRPEGTNVPFLPFIEMMRGWFGVPADASRDLAEAKLKDGLRQLKLDQDATLPYLLDLVIGGGSGEALALPASELTGLNTREAMRRFIFALCRLGRPVVMVVEDLHWIDSASQGVLDDIVKSATDEPLLLLCSFRPQFEPVFALAEGTPELRLNALTNVIATEIIRERLEGQALPAELLELGVAKSEGNPLFAEEFASYLSQKGGQSERVADASFGGSSGDFDDIPTSLENLIMDRVHRLGRDTIAFLQAASVLGRQFPMALAKQVAEINGKLVTLLPQLEHDGIIFRVERDFGESTADYAFRHALIQDALYGSLLTPQRAVLHGKAAEALEELYGDKAPEIADILAHHYARTERADKAVKYLALAAKKSLRVFSLAEAQSYLDRALARIAEEPDCAGDQELAEIVVDRLLVCCWEADFIGMRTFAEKYRTRIEAAGDSRELSRILAWLGEAYLNAARFDEAERVLDRARAIGEALEDEECIAYAMWDQMWLYMVTPDGRPADAIETMAKRVLQAADRLKDPYLETLTYFLLSTDAVQRGHAALAAKWAAKLIELGRRRRYPPAQSLGWVCSATAASFAGDHEKALVDAKLAVGTSHGHFERIMAESAQGVVLAGAGRAAEGLNLLERLRREVIEASYLVQLATIEIPCGVAMVQSGDYARGVADLGNTLARFAAWSNKRMVAAGHLALGQTYLSLANAKAPPARALRQNASFFVRAIPGARRRARRHFEAAVRCAREADAPGILAQGLAGLGRLAEAGRRPDAARKLLDEARAIAEEIGAKSLVGRIDAAL